jgi:hypothetical protein
VGGRVRGRDGQGLTFFQEQLREIFKGARDHEPGIRKIKSLRYRAGKVEGFGYNHLAIGFRKIEGDVVTKHESMLTVYQGCDDGLRYGGFCCVRIMGSWTSNSNTIARLNFSRTKAMTLRNPLMGI